MTFFEGSNPEFSLGLMMSLPPDNPFPNPSFASPVSFNVRPFGMNAPKLWPPPPVSSTMTLSSGSSVPYSAVISEPKIVPTALSVLDTLTSVILMDPFLRPFASSGHLGSLRYLLVLNLEEVGSADHLIDRSETEFCHDLS